VDRREAKEILWAYRPEAGDTADPKVGEALEAARRDPELMRWYEQQRAVDEAIRAELRQIVVPPGLRERILGAREVRKRVPRRRLTQLVAVAAAVALAVIVGQRFTADESSGFDAYREKMVEFVSDEYELSAEADDLEGLRRFFAKIAWPSDYVVPEPLKVVPVEGGTAMDWRGHRVSLLCLEREEHEDIWLFVIDRSALPDPPETEASQFLKVGRLMTASWSQENITYVLVAEGDEAFLRGYR
jgi:anti-sigma factor RsiW